MKKIISLFYSFVFLSFNVPVFAVNVPANTSIFVTPKEIITSKNNSIDIIMRRLLVM